MASFHHTRPSRRPAHAGLLPLFPAKPPLRWVAALGVLACALAAGLLAHGGGEGAPLSGKFLTQALGEKRPGAPLVRRPAPGVQVRLDASGFRVSRKQMQVGISLVGTKRGNWERFADGVSRPTVYGRETIVVDSTGTEQFLTVERRQGKRDWQWLLDTDARPRLQPDGSILYGAGLVRTPPVAILDAGGRNVTPEGLRWTLREQDGSWRLRLRLDDSKLSLPYVIDPAADYPSPLYLSNQASTETGSWKLITAAPSASDVTTNNTPAQNATGHYLWIPGQANTTATAPTTTPAGTGWVLDSAGGTGFPTGNWVFTVTTDIPNATLVGGNAILNVGIWKGTISGGVFTSTGVVLSPVSGDDPASQDLRAATTPITTNVTIQVPRFSLAVGERLFVEYRRNQVGGINSNVANRRALTFEVNAGANNQIAHPTADDVAPTNALSITNATGAHFSSGTLYYKSDAAGSFTFSNALTDGGSGPYGTTYPAIGTAGWTHALETVTTGPPHVSSTYSWTPNPTNPANQTLVGEDAAVQQTSSVVSFVSDTSAPTGMSASVTGGYFTSTSVPVTLANGSDAGSGINAASGIVERDEAPLDNSDGTCDAFPGSWATVTLSGGNDTGVVSGKCYRYRYKISDNVGNQGTQAGTSATAKIDTSAPSDPSLSYGSFTNAALNGGVVWYRPGAASGQFQVTAAGSTDTQSGVASHTFPAAASGWSASGSGNARTYSHSGSPTDPSEPNNVFSTNGAGLNSSSVAFTVTPDATGPSVTAPSVTAGYYTSLSVPVSLNGGSDGESGLAAGSSVVERDEAPLDNGDGSCDAFPGSWSTVTLSGGNDTTVASGKCYRYRELLTDRVGNQGSSSASSTAKIDASAPSDPSLSYGSFTNAAVNGGVVWYRPGAASGQFEVTASGSSDTQSGVASHTFPGPASGWSVSGSGNARIYSHSGSPSDPSEPNNVFTTNGAGLNSNNVSFTVTPDSTGPSVTAPTVTAGFYTSSSVGVSLNGGSDSDSGLAAGSSIVQRDEAPLDNADGSCDSFPGSWATVTLSGGNDTTVQSGKCYRYRELLTDNVGNQGASSASNTAKVETSAPSDPSLSYGLFTNAAVNGGVVWYRPSAASGQFQVTASSSDGQSGVSSYGFPAAASGWSVSGSGAARTYSHSGNPTNPAEPNDVFATNGAGLNSNNVSFTVSPDSTAPSVTTPGVTAGYYTSLSIPVALNGGSDSESGLAAGSSIVQRDEAPLDNGDGSCDAFPGSWATVTLAGGNDTTVVSGKCYRYRELLTDNVGNQGSSSASATAMVDTNTPSDPSLSYGSFTNAAVNGGVVWYRPAAASGQFQVTASSSDAQSGVASYGFPAAASGWSVSGSGNARTYSHSGSPTNPTEPNDVFATNGAGLNSNNVSFTVTPDSTAPSTTAPTVTAGYYTSLSIPVALNGGSDSESGIAAGSSVVERDEAPLDNGDGSCDAFPGSWTTVTLSGGNDTTVVSGKCYRYRELLTDNVGNQGSSGASNTAKVDTSAPAAPSLSYGSLSNAAVTGDTVYYRPSASSGQFQVTASSSDAQSGVASYGFPAAASGWGLSGTGASRTYSHSGSPSDPAEPLNVTSANGAGLASAASGFTVTPDATAPSGISASVTGGYYTSTSIAVTLDNGSDTGSGVDAASGIVERDEAPLDNGDGTCDAFPGSWSTVTLTGGNDTTVQSGKCYRYRYLLSDRVGNQATSGASATAKVDSSAPAAPSLSYGSLSNAVLNLGVVYYRPSAPSGQFAITASAADGQSGIASYGFAAAASGWSVSGSGDTRTYSHAGSPADPAEPNDVTAQNGAGLVSGATSFTVTPDGTPPTTSIQCDGGSCAGGWYTAAVSVSLSSVDGGSGLDEIRYTTDGSDPSPVNGTVYSSAFTVSSATTIRFRAYDRLGNEEAVGQQLIQIDPSGPATSASAANLSGSVHWNGSGTVFYRPGGSGSFDLTATVTDAQSGPQKANFPNVSGFGAGGDDTTVPFSKPYSYSGSPAEPGSQTVTGFNNANDSSSASVTITADSSAPSGISATVAGGYYTSASIAVTLDNGSDTGSGIDAPSGVVERDEAPLDNGDGSCDAFPGSWSTVTLSGGNDTTVVSGKCYRYRYLLSDRVGNQSTSGASATAKVDTSAPAAPSLSYGSLSNAAVTGDTVFFRPSAANGQFQVTAAASDAQSGIASHSFPAAASGWSLSGSGSARTYSHSGSPGDPAEPNDVSVTNGAGLASAASGFTVTPDASAPSGISASVMGGYYTSTSIAVTLDNGSDTGSGIDATSAVVERDEAPLDNGDGTCDAFSGSWSTVTLTGGNDTTVQSGKCYRYRYLLSDRVGNQATSGASATAKVDTSAPAAPTLSFGSLQAAFVAGSTVYYRPGAASGQFAVTATSTDAQSGIASYGFPAAASGWSVSGSGDTRTYSHSGSPTDPAEPLNVNAQNGASLVSGAAGYTVTPDASAPTSSILCDGASCPSWNTAAVSVTLSSNDTGSGLSEIRYTTDGSDPTPTTGTVYSGAFSVSATTEIRYRGFDRVGNAEAVQSETIEFDSTAPSAPALTLAESPADPDQHVSGSTVYYRPGGGRSGAFTVDAATSDAQSGVQKVTFPAVGGMTGGGDDFASPFQGSYGWTTGTGSSGAQTVTARDNAGLTSTGSFTVTPDATAPTGQTIDLVGGPYYTTLSVPVSLGNGSDGGSGVDGASGVVERDEAPLDNGDGTCDAFPGTWSTVTLTGGNDNTVQSGKCYRYRYTVSDNVGNQSSPSAQSADAKVDATTPVTSDDAPAGWVNSAVSVNLSVNESGSGVASTQYRVDGGSFQTGASVSIPAPADHSNDGVHTVEYRSADNAGNVETLRSATVRIDTTLPLTTDNAPAGWRNSAATVTLTASDALSGIASTEYRVDGGSFQNGASVSIPAPADHSNDGSHTIEYRSADNAGNTEALRSATVRIDTTLPTGSVSTPTEGQPVNGVVPVTAAGSDVPSGVISVEFFVRPNGAPGFTSISTDTTAPYEASWDSSSAVEGNAELKVVVVDAASNALTSAVRNVIVDNPPNVSLDDPGANVAGLINLTASSAPDTAQVVFERSPAGAGAWTQIATDLTAPFVASFDTAGVADDRYDFRAVATDLSGFGGTSALRTSRVDNTVPTVSISDPPNGAAVGGPNVHLGALASDLGSGVASVKFESRPAAGGAFNLIATDTVAPYDASWNASALSGVHELRATATDSAGNPASSVSVLVFVDSTAPSVTLDALGSIVRGVVTLSASTQGAAVTQVVFKRKPSGGASWTALETDTAGPWNAAFDTKAVSDGLYDLRAEALDSIGTVLASHSRENVRVDNTAPVIQSASPADGSSVSSATSIVLVADETVAAVRGATLDGAAATAEIAGARVTFATGTLASGGHTLIGSLEDAAGNASSFRVTFSVRAAAATTFVMRIGKLVSAKRGRNQIFSLPVTLSASARVKVTLLSPTGRRLRTATRQLPAGRRVVSLSIPRASLPPGRYTMLVTATSADGTQVLRRAQITIKKVKTKKQRRRSSNKPLEPRDFAAPPVGAPEPPPPPTTPSENTSDGLEPSPRETSEKPPARSKPLATATSFVGEKKRRTFGLAVVIMSIGGAIGFLIKIELHRLLGWPKRFAG